MKGWIKLLIMLGSKVMSLYQSNEMRIQKESMRLDKPCFEMVDIIYDLNERKRRIINLAVLNRGLKEGLSKEEYEIIKTGGEFFTGQMHRKTLSRRLDKAYIKAEKIIHSMGFDKRRLAREYPGYEREVLKF